jgi:hypothetical protein
VSSGQICKETEDTTTTDNYYDSGYDSGNPEDNSADCISAEDAANMTVQNLFEVGTIWGNIFSQMFNASINPAN